MSSCRSGITDIRSYEKFLRSRGFSRSEAKVLAVAYRNLEGRDCARTDAEAKGKA
jgi:hypothetical protein